MADVRCQQCGQVFSELDLTCPVCGSWNLKVLPEDHIGILRESKEFLSAVHEADEFETASEESEESISEDGEVREDSGMFA